MFDVNPVAIVTGASSGIGKEITKELANHNYSVAMLARSVTKMQQVIDEVGETKGTLLAIPCDISEPKDITNALRQVHDELGTVSVLVNNAGFGGPLQGIDTVSVEEWDYIFAVNVRGAFLCAQQVLPRMQQQQFGRIINISSILGLTGSAGSSAYIASKHALVGLSRSLAAEYGKYGITCNALCPGFIKTSMLENNDFNNELIQKIPMQRLGTSVEIAKLVTFLAGPDSYYLNGSIITADGGLLSQITC
jgi:3-oxoacyl-[acyl-carrier protein] reductase